MPAKRPRAAYAAIMAIVFAALAALAPAGPAAPVALAEPAAPAAPALSEAYAWERYADVFIAGGMNPESLSCRVSNQVAEVAGSGLLAERGVTVRTTILLDVSASMPAQARESVRSFIGALIEGVGKNEQCRLAAFGEQLSVLQDFTSDRYDLAAAASGIEFDSQQSRLYDAVYGTIPEGGPLGGSPCYYRTIVVTDGADDAAGGITKEELYLRLQASAYPIDVVAVSKASQAEPDKELSALTRMSGGRYASLSSETDAGGLASSLGTGGVVWLRAVLPSSLLDGSTRQFDITDGSAAVRFDFKVPVYDAPAAEPGAPQEAGAAGETGAGAAGEDAGDADGATAGGAGAAGEAEAEVAAGAETPGAEGEASDAEPESQPDAETGEAGGAGDEDGASGGGDTESGGGEDGKGGAGEDSETGNDEDTDDDGSRSDNSGRGSRENGRGGAEAPARGLPFSEALGEYAAVAYIGAGIAAILIVAAAIAFFVVRGKNKKGRKRGDASAGAHNARRAPDGKGGAGPGSKTEIVGNGSPGAVSGAGAGMGAGVLCARLRNVSNPDQIWNVSLVGGALIGRDTGCQICVADGSVSRQQCKLSVGANGAPLAENLSASNITQLNGQPLGAPRPFKEGDRLKCGRVTLMVDSLYMADSGNAGSLNRLTKYANV